MSKKTLILSGLLIVLLGIFFLSELYLPDFVAGKIQSEVEARFHGQVKVTEVEVRAKPALKLLLGEADSVVLRAENLSLGKLEAALLEVILTEVSLEFLNSGKRNASLFHQANTVKGNIFISEKALNRLIKEERFLPLEAPSLELKSKYFVLQGKIIILNNRVQTKVSGTLKAKEGNTIVFLPKDIRVAGFILPNTLREELLQQVAFELTFANLPFQLRLSNLEIREEGIRILLEK